MPNIKQTKRNLKNIPCQNLILSNANEFITEKNIALFNMRKIPFK
jgi:hypothetical protein